MAEAGTGDEPGGMEAPAGAGEGGKRAAPAGREEPSSKFQETCDDGNEWIQVGAHGKPINSSTSQRDDSSEAALPDGGDRPRPGARARENSAERGWGAAQRNQNWHGGGAHWPQQQGWNDRGKGRGQNQARGNRGY